MNRLKIVFCLAAVMMITATASAQQERKFVRRGNRDYKKENFNEAEINYMRALELDSASVAAKYNLSSALYKLERFDDALALQNAVAADSTQTDIKLSDLQFNTGNSYFEKQDYAKAIEQYKRSLRSNPDDYEAKYNLAYAQMMLQKQQQEQDNNQEQDQQQDNNGGGEDQNQDKNRDNPQNDKSDKDNQNGQDDQNNGNPDQQQQNDDRNGGDNQEPRDGQMSKREAEQLLKAIQNNEDKTQEKIKEQKARGVTVKGKKNW